jgi:DNA gyrase subunit B
MGGGGLPGKLSDCSEQDPAKCEVYLVEEIRQGERQNKVVIVLSSNFTPLRGKNLNEKTMHHKVFENEEIRNIFSSWCTVGTEEDSKALNISKLLTIK